MKNKFISQLVLVLAFGVFLIGCFEPPEFAVEPSISFAKLEFKPVANASDSLVLTFNFQDGDGDIGLSPNQTGFPYHPFNLVIDSEDSPVFFNDDRVIAPLFLVDPLDRRTFFSEEDNRPPYSCDQYVIQEFFSSGDADTVYIQQNEFNRNIYIDFYRKENGEYVSIDDQLSLGSCAEAFDARIPIFDRDNLGRSLSGTISYALLSQGFPLVFLNDTIKMDFYIYDQALNRSNVTSTGDFTLRDVTVE